MKSTNSQLNNRGYLPENHPLSTYNHSISELLNLLKSKTAQERTLAARLLKHRDCTDHIETLVQALKTEKKLYPKIELSELLCSCGQPAIKALIKQLGKIGNNQHKQIPNKQFQKKSYPLPRDLAARILSRMGHPALIELIVFIEDAEEIQLSEAIDAIGFICFYKPDQEAFHALNCCYQKHSSNELIKWKITQAYSAFPESLAWLETEKQALPDSRILSEINRSISILKQNH